MGSPEAEAGRGAGSQSAASRSHQRFRFADLTIDLGQRKLLRGEVELYLPKLSFDLITTLVSAAPNSLSIDELMDRVWPGAVVSPTTVAKRVELVREVLGDHPRDPRYIELVRGFGYRLIPEVEAAQPATPSPRRRTIVTALVAAGLVVTAGAIWLVVTPATTRPEKSVAVMPFENLTDDAGDRAFADGLTEELSHELARSGELKVSGRYSVFHFRGRDEDIRVIADTLGVAHLLTGSVRRAGEQLRITAQLVHAASGRLLWSENYDRTMANVIDVQQEIARTVASRLRVLLGEPGVTVRAVQSPDPEAYALYLKARGLAPYGAAIDLPEAQRLLGRAVQLDPEFAPAWSLLASVHGRRMFNSNPQSPYPLPREEGLRIVRDAVARALAIDPESSRAFAVLGGVAWIFEGDARKAAPLIEKAVNLDPANLEAIAFAAEFAKFIGRLDEALALEKFIVDRDPLCAACRTRLFRTYYFLGRFEDAEREALIVNEMEGGGFDIDIGLMQLFQGQPERALETFESMHGKDYPAWWTVMGRALALHDLGRHAESNALIDQFIEGWGDIPRNAENIAQTLAYVGRVDEAFEWLDRSLQGENFLQVIYPDPQFGNLHGDPRWHEFLERIGRAPEQLRQIRFSPIIELEG